MTTFLIIVAMILSVVLPIVSAFVDTMPTFWSVLMIVLGILYISGFFICMKSALDSVSEIVKLISIERGKKAADKILKDLIADLIISNGAVDFDDILAFCKRNPKISVHSEYINACLNNDVTYKIYELIDEGKVKKLFIGDGQYIYINITGTGATLKTNTIELTVD